jgi:hypothetical protein
LGRRELSSLDLQIFPAEVSIPLQDTITKTQECGKNPASNGLRHLHQHSLPAPGGIADEFSKQPPAKRKEVLASILKLEIYDELAETARQKTRDRQAEKEALARTIEEIKNRACGT